MTHPHPHELAGQTVLWGAYAFKVQDWWDRVSGQSWNDVPRKGPELTYALQMRRAGVPADDEVVVGTIGGDTVLLHNTQLGEVLR